MQLTLSTDQAIVLSDWLNRVMHREDFAALVDDRAVWSALLSISGTLEVTVAEVFSADYVAALEAARKRLIEELGEFGL